MCGRFECILNADVWNLFFSLDVREVACAESKGTNVEDPRREKQSRSL